MILLDISVFESQKKVFSTIFYFVLNFHDFFMFSVSRKTCHSTIQYATWYINDDSFDNFNLYTHKKKKSRRHAKEVEGMRGIIMSRGDELIMLHLIQTLPMAQYNCLILIIKIRWRC